MSKLKYYYAKLSCPVIDDGQVFLNLFDELSKNEIFDFTLTNIPNNLDNASSEDVIFIHIGGDSSNKRRYFKDNIEFNNYNNGLHCIGLIKEIRVDEKEVTVKIIGLEEVVTKEDLYFFPQFINNLGASTKGTPNQAGLYEIDQDIALSLIDYLKKREILSSKFVLPENILIDNNLFSVAVKDYKDNFKEKELTQKIFREYTNEKENSSKSFDNVYVVTEFVKWFNLEENFKASYKGIVNEENLLFWDRVYFNSKLYNLIGENKDLIYENISSLIYDINDQKWDDFNFSTSKGAPKAVLGDKNYLKFLKLFLDNNWQPSNQELFPFGINDFADSVKSAGLVLTDKLLIRYVSSLLTKPFVILTGLSGSGKTKLAQAFAMWMSESKQQYALVPVGADWTNREPLLGYPNSLLPHHYVKPDTGVLDILLNANRNYLENNKDLKRCKPYFLILDEMNLSHVERYFADFLSTMESGDAIKLYSGAQRFSEFDEKEVPIQSSKIPSSLELPKNLYIVGTVNIDETTYMFSPKVLDRANTIEFRVTLDEMKTFYKESIPLKMYELIAKGSTQALSFMQLAAGEGVVFNGNEHKETLVSFFEILQTSGTEFGYRTAKEMMELMTYLKHLGMTENEAYDIAIMQKLLPKLHGSRSKLNKILPALISLCEGKYLISLEKLQRMLKNTEENGFASYAEA